MMQIIRSKAGKFIVLPIMIAFLAWMVYGLVADATTFSNQNVGSVNGEPITVAEYQQALETMQQQAQLSSGGRLTPEQLRAIRERAWNSLVEERLFTQEIRRRGIRVSTAEIAYAARFQPHPSLAREEIFQKNGQFDLQEYQRFLASPNADENMLAQLEAYYRAELPRQKLARQLLAGTRVSESELWRAYRDQTETATIEFVSLDLLRLAPGDVQVSDAQVRAYYDEHRDEDPFQRPRTARVTVAYIPKTGPGDREATLQRVHAIRQRIVGGQDFAAVARAESKDPGSAAQGGDLGTFRRGQMVPAFDSVAFSLPVGQVSEPVETEFGFHLIQVTERTGDEAKGRHILIPVGKSDQELERLDARADSIRAMATRGTGGMDRAARAVGATLRRSVPLTETLPVIPGVGPALEALDWAAAVSQDEEAGPNPVSDVLETDQALYVVQLEQYLPAGRMSLAEATPQIRRDLVLKARRDAARRAGQALVAEVRRGRPLQQVAAARGLTVQTAGPFTRVMPNPQLGQANAAIGAAFGTPLNQVSNVVETQTGLFIIRPTQRTEANRQEFERQRETLRASQEAQLQQGVLQRWLLSVRENAEIEDNRERLGLR